MAMRDIREDDYYPDVSLPELESLLPPMPPTGAIKALFPHLRDVGPKPGKFQFVNWIDFTLENPDEIWENDGGGEDRFFHYFGFLDNDGDVPVFVVETVWSDELMEVKNFSLVVDPFELSRLREGTLIYSLRREWQRERLIRELNAKALTRYDEERLPEARQLMDAAIELSGYASAYLYNNRGLICWKMGMTEQAKADFLESMKLDQDNGDPCFNIGLIYFDEADLAKAAHFLQLAVKLNPLDSQFLTELGHVYLELDREMEALELFDRAFDNNPEDAQVDFHLGYYFLYKKNQPRHALKYFSNGLKKEPLDQYALADLAIAHLTVGNTRKALGILRAVQEQAPLMPYTMSRIVYLNLQVGDYQTALKYYRQALLQREPFEPEWLHYHAALVYAKIGRSKKALDTLELAIQAGGEAVIKRARTETALSALKGSADFKRLTKLPGKRRSK
jgi:tetratricopeptide (TPR) repeat protein